MEEKIFSILLEAGHPRFTADVRKMAKAIYNLYETHQKKLDDNWLKECTEKPRKFFERINELLVIEHLLKPRIKIDSYKPKKTEGKNPDFLLNYRDKSFILEVTTANLPDGDNNKNKETRQLMKNGTKHNKAEKNKKAVNALKSRVTNSFTSKTNGYKKVIEKEKKGYIIFISTNGIPGCRFNYSSCQTNMASVFYKMGDYYMAVEKNTGQVKGHGFSQEEYFTKPTNQALISNGLFFDTYDLKMMLPDQTLEDKTLEDNVLYLKLRGDKILEYQSKDSQEKTQDKTIKWQELKKHGAIDKLQPKQGTPEEFESIKSAILKVTSIRGHTNEKNYKYKWVSAVILSSCEFPSLLNCWNEYETFPYSWGDEGLPLNDYILVHNPNASIPLDKNILPVRTEIYLDKQNHINVIGQKIFP